MSLSAVLRTAGRHQDAEAEASKAFAALSDGGKVTMPLTKTFFAKSFGVLDDRFGVSWMIVVMA